VQFQLNENRSVTPLAFSFFDRVKFAVLVHFFGLAMRL
jgi:hypothetical protein